MPGVTKVVNRRAIVCGSVVEIYEYERPVIYGKASSGGNYFLDPGSMGSDYKRKKNRYDAVRRAKVQLRRIINSNFGAWGGKDKFVTLTFRENVTDIERANYEWKKFKQRFEYFLGGNNLKYSTVIEFQKRGAVHYHSILYNSPFVYSDMLADIWGNGFIRINKLDCISNVGNYVVKYMTKDSETYEKLRGKKMYFNSRGLKKPVEVVDEKKIDAILASGEVSYHCMFDTEYHGQVNYSVINLTNQYKEVVAL